MIEFLAAFRQRFVALPARSDSKTYAAKLNVGGFHAEAIRWPFVEPPAEVVIAFQLVMGFTEIESVEVRHGNVPFG